MFDDSLQAQIQQGFLPVVTCPLSKKVMIDPVMATDGHVYERVHITHHLDAYQNQPMSPVTNEPLGPQLVPAMQVRTLIEYLIRSYVLGEEQSESWRKREATMIEGNIIEQQAMDGKPSSMTEYGMLLNFGVKGRPRDPVKAVIWFKRAACAGNAKGKAMCARAFLEGDGVESDWKNGLLLLGAACELGSETALYVRGMAHAENKYNFTKNRRIAASWFEQMHSAVRKDCPNSWRKNAREWLERYRAEEDSDTEVDEHLPAVAFNVNPDRSSPIPID